MGADTTQPAKLAELARAKFLRDVLQRSEQVFSSAAMPTPAQSDLVNHSFAPENPELQCAYLEQIVECAPEAISILDSEYRITRLNSEFTRIFGFVPEEALGRRVESLIVPPDRGSETRWITDLLVKGQKVVFETKRQLKDGTQFRDLGKDHFDKRPTKAKVNRASLRNPGSFPPGSRSPGSGRCAGAAVTSSACINIISSPIVRCHPPTRNSKHKTIWSPGLAAPIIAA